jgi:hypothetical protein
MWGLERAVMVKMPESPVLVGNAVRDKKLYNQACALVDTSRPGWRILFANKSFTDLTGEHQRTIWGRPWQSAYGGWSVSTMNCRHLL